MEWIWKTLTEQWAVVTAAPYAFGIAVFLSSILVGIAIFLVLEWIHREKLETQEQRISLLAERLEEQRKATQVAVDKVADANAMAEKADLRLLTYDDERTPTRISAENIWIWYWMRNILKGVAIDGTLLGESTTTILFISFEIPVIVGSLEIRSPDFTVPRYEVKAFYPRFAIVAFDRKMPAGALEISVMP